jgi:hypothetical protein
MSMAFTPLFLVASVAAAKTSIVDIPYQDNAVATRYEVSITVPRATISELMETHRKKCLDLGGKKCQVYEYQSPNPDYPVQGSLKLRFAPSLAEPFVDDLASGSSSSGATGMTRRVESRRHEGQSVDQSKLDIMLLQVQRDKLKSLEENADRSMQRIISAKISGIDNQISNFEDQISQIKPKIGMDEVNISYIDTNQPQNSSQKSDLEKLWQIILYGLIGSIGIALVTMLYLGTIGFSLLWLRKLARKFGLLQNGGSRNSAQ